MERKQHRISLKWLGLFFDQLPILKQLNDFFPLVIASFTGIGIIWHTAPALSCHSAKQLISFASKRGLPLGKAAQYVIAQWEQ